MNIKLYTTQNCPTCNMLKETLRSMGIDYSEICMSTPAALTELRMNGVYAMSAPVLQIKHKFYTDKKIFTKEQIQRLIL